MQKRLLIISILIFMLAVYARSESVYSLINEGKLKEAVDSLSRQTTASSRNGDILFFQSLVEQDGLKSAQLMQAALKASVSPEYLEEIYFRLAGFYFINNDYENLSRIVNEYHTRWEEGRYSREFMRFSVLIDQMNKDYDAALRQTDRYLLKWSKDDEAQLGVLDKARILLAHNKTVGAVKLLRDLSREKDGPGIAQALYLLTRDAIEKKRTDDAVFYYNLLREAYPASVGLDNLIEKIGGIENNSYAGNAAEKLTGTYYTVKVGVFSSKGNARTMAEMFEKYNRKIDIETKTISGKKYQVVYVGRFDNYEEAFQFKTQLEAAHSEVFQVVAR
ncbi:MAG: SPOR domain-containing protein [candidate division Zixibacteria bacterium]|nr:SPOR domain-containing protein [candidate division Zixibacteria bacterium]